MALGGVENAAARPVPPAIAPPRVMYVMRHAAANGGPPAETKGGAYVCGSKQTGRTKQRGQRQGRYELDGGQRGPLMGRRGC